MLDTPPTRPRSPTIQPASWPTTATDNRYPPTRETE